MILGTYYKSNLKRRLKMEVNENLYYLIRYIAEFHQAPKSRTIYEGRKIGLYLQNVKRGKQNISSEDSLFLIRLNINLSTENPQIKVHKKLLILVEFINKNNRRPNSSDVYKGIKLYTFLRNIQTGNTYLSKKDRAILLRALEKVDNTSINKTEAN